MKHFLLWNPVIVPGEDVKYSVEFQGEYERDYANDSWISIEECTDIRITQCDITEDISATVPYSLPSLIPPTLTVTADGYHLLVELGHLGPGFEFWIFYWRKSQEYQVHHKVVRESGTAVHLETMEAEAEYCVKAQTYVEAINRSSNFSDVQCVKAREINRINC
ncbi:hypothetical protein JRQ81_011704 [Phrynocephalus forsythii]|uniref:Uncharacterized protein n=1 Tax=Phrynocephalus forsythii TaxID=171643 RepID=A0A9Q0X6Q0_9SAUR|nr:hypothetical protein JRQ81_011704 [Phrynocephalus forsythii]